MSEEFVEIFLRESLELPSVDENSLFSCYLTFQRKNEFLQRNSKPEDRQIEKQRNNRLTSHGRDGTFLQYSC